MKKRGLLIGREYALHCMRLLSIGHPKYHQRSIALHSAYCITLYSHILSIAMHQLNSSRKTEATIEIQQCTANESARRPELQRYERYVRDKCVYFSRLIRSFFFRSNRWLSLCSLSLSLTLGHVFAVLILACCFCSTSFHSHGRHYRVRLPQLGQSHRRFEFTIRGLVSWKKTSIASHAFIQTMQRIDGQRVLHVFRVIYSFFAVF